MVPCMDCRGEVELAAFADDFARTVAAPYLAAKGEPPLRDDELTRCAPCGVKWRERCEAEFQAQAKQASEFVRECTRTGRLSSWARQWLQERGYHETVQGLEEMLTRARRPRQGPQGEAP